MLMIHNEINRAVSTLQTLDPVLEIIYQQVQRIAKVDAFYISLYNPELDQISFPLVYDMGIRYQEPTSHLEKNSRIAKVILSGNPLLEDRTADDMQTPVEYGFADTSHKAASLLIVPLKLRGRVTGVISIQSYSMNAYTDEDIKIISSIGYQAVIAIENAQLFTEAQQELQERKRIEIQREMLIKELETKNAELERFTYTVSHDLISPLVTIQGFLGYLEKDAVSGDLDRLKADVNRISAATEKMQRLLNELLELSRIGRIMNLAEETNFSQLAQESVDLVQGQIQKRGVRIYIADNMASVYGDRARLLEVVQNMVDNAVKFMGNQADPRIEIGKDGTDPEGNPIFFVQDNGIGIEPQHHERIFGLFNKLDTQTEGTGIGLALVKRIIEFHGGRIWVESEGAGKGTKFLFSLPRHDQKGDKV
jgi:signal transduction histidine kinase